MPPPRDKTLTTARPLPTTPYGTHPSPSPPRIYLHLTYLTPPFLISAYTIRLAARQNVHFLRTESPFPGIRNPCSGPKDLGFS
ncbi:unnamed protein product, partial [Nesidiocoris tenuis]